MRRPGSARVARLVAALTAALAPRFGGWLARPGGRWREIVLRRRLLARLALAGVTAAIAGCVPRSQPGALAPTLTLDTVDGGVVAMQDGIPVPSFELQGQDRISLDGMWRVERKIFDSAESLTPRDVSLAPIEAESNGAIRPEFDDSDWATIPVPGALNPPPDRLEVGAWYRRSFDVPPAWSGRAITLKFAGVNYLADVWLNGVWLGYHEGGTTPFAFDAAKAIAPGTRNQLVVRVDNPAWGTRNDIVPWGLADWWNFGGITRSVWLEATDTVTVARADVSPHLDGADISVVVTNRGEQERNVGLDVEILPALVGPGNLLDPDPRSLLTDAPPVARVQVDPAPLAPGDVRRVDTSVLVADAAAWSPSSPSLYAVRVTAIADGIVGDQLVDTFGFRQISVDPDRPAVRLNGNAVVFAGVALHDQDLATSESGTLTGRIATVDDIRTQLRRAKSLDATLIRTGHTPANPITLRLADRLGFAIWEEIPLYHYTPQTFDIAMGRGIPQQMLREMALRDMNRPSVLFHGLANESTGDEERTKTLTTLRDIDREIDGTRLTGQAAYGFNTADPTNDPLDVAGFTFYYGVFYGADPASGTAQALEIAHATFPKKPVVVLEFGRWADNPGQYPEQTRIFDSTAPQIFSRRDTSPGGYVAAGVWWTLADYATLRPFLQVEHFGMYEPDGRPRPIAATTRAYYGTLPAGLEPATGPPGVPGGRGTTGEATRPGQLLLGYLGYGMLIVVGTLVVALVLLLWRGGRSGIGRVADDRRNAA